MQNHPMVSALALALLLFSAAACVRAPEQTGTVDTALEENSETSKDLTGVIWMLSRGKLLTLSEDVFPRNPLGEARFNANKPSYGPRAVPPALGNDPIRISRM